MQEIQPKIRVSHFNGYDKIYALNNHVENPEAGLFYGHMLMQVRV